MTKLYDCAIAIEKRIAEIQVEDTLPTATLISSTKDNNKGESDGKRQSEQQQQHSIQPTQNETKKIIRFKSRSRESLHMTFFFGGETLGGIPSTELIEWHSRISKRLAQSGFCLSKEDFEKKFEGEDVVSKNDSEHLSVASPSQSQLPDDFSFHVQGLEIFPPRRNNLVVAILIPTMSQSWQTLYDDIRTISQDESCSRGLSEICKDSKDKWVAHVTLGNIYGGKKGNNKQLLDPILREIFTAKTRVQRRDVTSTSANHQLHEDVWEAFPTGISMGGPIPSQAVLDWDFDYKPQK